MHSTGSGGLREACTRVPAESEREVSVENLTPLCAPEISRRARKREARQHVDMVVFPLRNPLGEEPNDGLCGCGCALASGRLGTVRVAALKTPLYRSRADAALSVYVKLLAA